MPEIIHGDCVEQMRAMPDCSVDAIVTDPPYELGFMGKRWDAAGIAYSVELWAEALRVLKPGGHLLAFGGTRTYHRMACAIEDAGFEIRDSIHWVYGSGFPKSLDVAKAMTAHQRSGKSSRRANRLAMTGEGEDAPMPTAGLFDRTDERSLRAPRSTPPPRANMTDEARRWEGWGTALKPAHEPIVVARKPLQGTVAGNVLAYGTGGLNIDGCRIGTDGGGTQCNNRDDEGKCRGHANAGRSTSQETVHAAKRGPSGRWPANVVFDRTAGQALDEQSGVSTSPVGEVTGQKRSGGILGLASGRNVSNSGHGDTGGASRFFTQADFGPDDWPFVYQAKPSRKERNAGLEGLPEKAKSDDPAGYANARRGRCHSCLRWADSGEGDDCRNCGTAFDRTANEQQPMSNHHPTVKPVALMRHLVRLVTPPGGVVLDPFAGSGTTLVAAILEGFECVGIEMTDEYLPIIQGRVAWAQQQVAEREPRLL